MLSINEISNLTKKHADFPRPGILFKDVMPIFKHPQGLFSLNRHFSEHIKQLSKQPDAIIGIDARGFILGSSLASFLRLPFVTIRKKGKLPGKVISCTYDLEYGTDTLEIQQENQNKYKKVVLCDDLLATGGTIMAAEKLCQNANLEVLASLFIIEIKSLLGRERISSPIFSLIAE